MPNNPKTKSKPSGRNLSPEEMTALGISDDLLPYDPEGALIEGALVISNPKPPPPSGASKKD